MKMKTAELILTVLGAVLVSLLIYVSFNTSFLTVPVIAIILSILMVSGIWRWKQGDSIISDSDLHIDMEVRCDDLNSFGSGMEYRCLGPVYGEAIVATHMINDMWSSLKIVMGGEPKSYSRMMGLARRTAVERMKKEAKDRGADLITSHRLSTSSITNASAEMISYGTAWKANQKGQMIGSNNKL